MQVSINVTPLSEAIGAEIKGVDLSLSVSASDLQIIHTAIVQNLVVVIRDQRKKFIRHVYIRNNDQYTFDKLPITRLYVQFKSKEFFFEDLERTTVNYGDRHKFNFFFDPSQDGNYFRITDKEFFKP